MTIQSLLPHIPPTRLGGEVRDGVTTRRNKYWHHYSEADVRIDWTLHKYMYTCTCTCGLSNLFKLEDVFVEVLLQLFIGIVDTELLKGVLLKNLKAKDVQHANGVSLKRWYLPSYISWIKTGFSMTHLVGCLDFTSSKCDIHLNVEREHFCA